MQRRNIHKHEYLIFSFRISHFCLRHTYGELSEEVEDDIKGLCAGVENFGNFFGQNCFLGASGTLLIVSTLTEQGVNVMKDGNPVPVDVLGIAMWSIPIAIVSVILGIIYFVIYDRKLEKALGGK